VDPDAFTETEVRVGSEPWVLQGTLSMPKGEGPFPAVVLLAGSGPNDRDESIGPNAPLRDIAWGLASNGIAVLRYDKRTKAHQVEMAADVAERHGARGTIDDALAAIELLRVTPGVDRTGVRRGTAGGYLAAVAAEAPSWRHRLLEAGGSSFGS
jgi:dienelactone hydrolase